MQEKKKKIKYLLVCLQWLLTKILPRLIIPSKEIVSNSHDIWHKKLRNYPLEQFLIITILLCISLSAIWPRETTHWTFAFEVLHLLLCSMSDFLVLSQFATDSFRNLQVVNYFFYFCRITVESYVWSSSLREKGLPACVTQTRPNQEWVQQGWRRLSKSMGKLHSIHFMVRWEFFTFQMLATQDFLYACFFQIFDSQCTKHWRIMQDYSLSQITIQTLTFWKVFSVLKEQSLVFLKVIVFYIQCFYY